VSRTWVNLFANGEIKAIGIGKGKSWIVQTGASLPFSIGSSGVRRVAAQSAQDSRHAAARRTLMDEPTRRPGGQSEFVFIQ